MPYEHYTTTASKLAKDTKELFGELNLRQIWLIVKIAKLIRRSCRNNSAFNTALGVIFDYAKFRQVTKTNPTTQRTYPGLEITVKGETSQGDNSEDED